MKLTKRIIVGTCSITGALAVVGSLTSCGGSPSNKYTISFVGENYSLAGKSFKFELGNKLTYQLSPTLGYQISSNIECKFGDTIKVKGRDYTFDGQTFTIPSAPASNVTVNVTSNKITYTPKFIGETDKSSSYVVTTPKDIRTYQVGDKNLTYTFESDTAMFPEKLHVYYDGVEQDKNLYTYTNNVSNDETYTKKAKLIIKTAPAANITVSFQPDGKHVVYYKSTNAKIENVNEGFKEIDEGSSVTLNIKANNEFSHLPNKSGVEIYKGDKILAEKDFTYELKDDSDLEATLTITNIDNFIAININADTEMLTYQDIKDDETTCSVTGINPDYISTYGEPTDIQMPSTFRGKNVVKINAGVFKDNKSIKSISAFSGNLTEIGDDAFNGCSNLEFMSEIYATNVGERAFKGCENLNILNAPSLKVIGANAFEGCSSMTLGTLMLNLVEIGDYAFKDCTNMSRASDEKGYITSPLVISSGNSGYGFDITKLGKGVCEGWKTNEAGEEQIIVFAGDNKNAKDLEKYGYKTEPIKQESTDTGYYKEVSGGTKTLGGNELGNITIAFTDLNLFSWSEISRISNAGYAKYIWNIGDTRLNESVSKVQYRIIGFDHDDKVNGYGKAGITFETVKLGFIDGIEQLQFTDKAPASYTNSLIKDKFNIDFYNSDEIKAGGLRDVIKLVNKKCILDKDHPDELVEENQFLFPLSYVEIGGEVETYQQYKLEGSTYAYYKNSSEATRKKMRQKYEQSSSFILRSPYLISQSYNNKYMIGIDLNGRFFPFNAAGKDSSSKPFLWAYSYAFCV